MCVYNSEDSFSYITDSVSKTLMGDRLPDDRVPFQGLPVIVVMVTQQDSPSHLSLREAGRALAERYTVSFGWCKVTRMSCNCVDVCRLQCPFMEMTAAGSVRLHLVREQLEGAVRSLLSSIHNRLSLINHWQVAESIEPDIWSVDACI